MRDAQRILMSSEARELNDEVARLFDELGRTRGDSREPHGHCTPLLDVVQSDELIEVVVDVPGVAPDRLRVLLKDGVLVIVGEKASPYPGACVEGTFHMVERGFGRFARVVRLDGAVDGSAARGVLGGGELRISIPRIPERRGREITVPIVTA